MNVNTRIPYEPKSVQELRAQFAMAIAEQRANDRPAQRRHTLDFHSGVRVVATLDPVYEHEPPRVHISISAWLPGALGPNPEADLRRHWELLTDLPWDPDEDGVGITPRGYAHVWMRPTPRPPAGENGGTP